MASLVQTDLPDWIESPYLEDARVAEHFQRAWGSIVENVLLQSPLSSVELCESPIEVMLLSALSDVFSWEIAGGGLIIQCQDRIFCHEKGKQKAKYRVDFHIFSYPLDPKTSVVIECDGHDFHERTKEQARADKSRDRGLVAEGYTILRFTGSEIYADAWACARQVYQVVMGRTAEGVG